MSWLTIIAVASGGAFGALLRMMINGFVNRHVEHTLPFGTLTANLLGSLVIGILFAWFHINTSLSPHMKSFLVTGLLGAMTTYSTFAIESFFLLESGHYGHAFANMALNLFGTILMAGIGYLGVLQLAR
ncbi:MAG: fluoride efflux transporter CrcB [Campylobacterota bacterium]|nr:fluoride efflux transporter CrcB [Campylobacterota bacterium]